MDNRFVLGLDIGVASIGWSCMLIDAENNPYRILDCGAVYFSPLDSEKGKLHNEDRRNARGARRVLRRRKERVRRIKNFLVAENLISKSEYEELFNDKGDNIVELKVRGLLSELSSADIARCLVHYAKNRGFKSNRKNSVENETGELSKDLKRNEQLIASLNITPSQLIIQNVETPEIVTELIGLDEKEEKKRLETTTKRYKNTNGDYRFSFNRSDVEREIIKLLENQMLFHEVITEQFISKYLEIWNSQRDYSDGPASGKYQVDWESTFRNSKFTGKKCASKGAPSFERFRLIQALQNFRYKSSDFNGTYQLDVETIKSFANKFLKKPTKEIKYSAIVKHLQQGSEEYRIVNLPQLSRDKYIKVSKEYEVKIKKSHLEFTEDDKIAVKKLAEAERLKSIFSKLPNTALFSKHFIELQKEISQAEYVDFCDEVATVLAYARTDQKITSEINQDGKYPTITKVTSGNPSVIEEILELKFTDVTGSAHLDLDHIKQLNNIMLNGLTYTEAMDELGYDHSIVHSDIQFSSMKFPTVKQIETAFDTMITSPNVKHMLVNLRKLYNEITRIYGVPEYIHIETARDIANTFSKRNEIKRDNENRYVEKQDARAEAINNGASVSKGSLSSIDELKVKLWRQQENKCMYSGKVISYEQLFKMTEVDHILPFSRSFDNSQNNKVVVFSQENQEKGNKTPFEWMKGNKEKWADFKLRVDLLHLSRTKKENLINDDFKGTEGFLDRYLHATSHTSKLAIKTFQKMLDVDEYEQNLESEIKVSSSSKIKIFKGGVTSLLRKYLKLNDLTHSYESKDYSRRGVKYRLKGMEDLEKTNIISFNVDDKSGKYAVSCEWENNHGVVEKSEVTIWRSKKTREFRNATDAMIWKIIVSEQERFSEYLINLNSNGEDLFSQQEKHIYQMDDDGSFYDAEIAKYGEVVSRLYAAAKIQILTKNRDNHLHHIVDATLLSLTTISVQQRLTKFMKQEDEIKRMGITEPDENGEVLTKQDRLMQFDFGRDITYNDFYNEVKYRIFERDEEVMRDNLSRLSNYADVDVNNIYIKYPRYMKASKTMKKLHKDTIYGTKHLESEQLVTIRKQVKDLKEADFDKIYNVKMSDGTKGPQYELYEKLVAWDKNNRRGVPKLNNGNEIHKVKIQDRNVDKLIHLGNGKAAMIAEVESIEIYKKSDSDKFYFVQISGFQRQQLNKGRTNFNVTVWFGRDSNKITCLYCDLGLHNLHLYTHIEPGDHIAVKTSKSQEVVTRVVGFTSGALEVKSLLGDQLDVISAEISGKIKERVKITVSTVERIRKVNLSYTGRYNELSTNTNY